MSFILHLGHIVFAVFWGWVNKRQQQIIEFQNAQIEALLKKLGKKHLLLIDNQCRVLRLVTTVFRIVIPEVAGSNPVTHPSTSPVVRQ